MGWGYNHQPMSNWWLLIMKSKVNIEVRLVSGLCWVNSRLNITLLFCFVIYFSFINIFHKKASIELSACWAFFLFSQVNTVINCGYIIKMFCWSPRVKTIKMQQINCRPSTLSRELYNEFEDYLHSTTTSDMKDYVYINIETYTKERSFWHLTIHFR